MPSAFLLNKVALGLCLSRRSRRSPLCLTLNLDPGLSSTFSLAVVIHLDWDLQDSYLVSSAAD